MQQRAESLGKRPWLIAGGGAICSAAVFAGMLALNGPFSTQFEWAVESLVGGVAVLGFFVSVLAALYRAARYRTVQPNLLIFASLLTVLGLLGVVGSFWLPGRGFPGSAGYRAYWGYIFFSVFSGSWYMLILGVAGVIRSARHSAK
jgi:hypothetical protein